MIRAVSHQRLSSGTPFRLLLWARDTAGNASWVDRRW